MMPNDPIIKQLEHLRDIIDAEVNRLLGQSKQQPEHGENPVTRVFSQFLRTLPDSRKDMEAAIAGSKAPSTGKDNGSSFQPPKGS